MNSIRVRSRLPDIVAVICATFMGPLLHAELAFQTVATSGQAAPGTPLGVVFLSTSFTLVGIDSTGKVFFHGNLTGAGVNSTNDTGFWVGTPGSVALLARRGDAAPGTSGGTVFSQLNMDGGIGGGYGGFFAFLSGPGVVTATNSGVWADSANGLALLVRRGDAAPGTGLGVTFNAFGGTNTTSAANSIGQRTFTASLTGTGVTTANDTGLWVGAPGAVSLLAREGDQAPGQAAGVTFGAVFPTSATPINASGQAVFFSGLTGTGVTTANDTAIWRGSPGNVALVAREGDAAPGTTVVFGSLAGSTIAPAFNSAGRTAFNGILTGLGVTTANDRGIWTGTPGNLSLLVREGDAVPGTPLGSTVASLGSTVALNSSGQHLFFANLIGTGITSANDSILLGGTPGSLHKIFAEGDAVPGLTNGTLFGPVNSQFALNDAGNIVFLCSLTGTGVTADNDLGLWTTDGLGNFSLLLRKGDPFSLAPGAGTTITNITFPGGSGDENGLPGGFNDAGQIVFRLTFSDGAQGIYVVPEPSSALLFAAAGLALLHRRCRGAGGGR